jgi:hypothetical protein
VGFVVNKSGPGTGVSLSALVFAVTVIEPMLYIHI